MRLARFLVTFCIMAIACGMVATGLVIGFRAYAAATRFPGLRPMTEEELRRAPFDSRLAKMWYWRRDDPGGGLKVARFYEGPTGSGDVELVSVEAIELPLCSGLISDDGRFEVGPQLAKIGSLRFDAIVGRVRGPGLLDGRPAVWLEAKTILKRPAPFPSRNRFYTVSTALFATGRK